MYIVVVVPLKVGFVDVDLWLLKMLSASAICDAKIRATGRFDVLKVR